MAKPYKQLYLYPDSDLRREGSSSTEQGESPKQEDDTSARLLDGIAEVIETMADPNRDSSKEVDGKADTHKDTSNQTAVFAIYGGWGTGKTTFMWDLYAKLKEGGKVVPIWFNLWEHDKDEQPIVAMLNLASERLPSSWTPEEKKSFKSWLKVTAMGIYDMAAHAASAVTGGMASFPTVSNIHDYHEMVQEEKWLNMEDQTKKKQAFEEVVKTLRMKAGNKRIVFFIDDLDRCTPGVAVDLLEKIRLYLTMKDCMFVIGADDTPIRRAIGDAYMTDSDREYAKIEAHNPKNTDDEDESDQSDQPLEAEDKAGPPDQPNQPLKVEDRVDQEIWNRKEKIGRGYLEKMVQHAFYLPVLGKEDAEKFLENILKENKLPLDKNALTVLSAGIASVDASRREIIRVGNAFTLNYYLSQPKIGTSYLPSITALVTILQVLHPETYEKLRLKENRELKLQDLRKQSMSGKNVWLSKVGGLRAMFDALKEVPNAMDTVVSDYVELSPSESPSSSEPVNSVLKRRRWAQDKAAQSYDDQLFPTDMMVKKDTPDDSYSLDLAREDLRRMGKDAVKKTTLIGQYLWRVLHFDGSKFILITEHVIGLHCFSNEDKDGGWKPWTQKAVTHGMSEKDAEAICKGLRLIEATEAEKYFDSDTDRIGYGTYDTERTVGLWWWTQTDSGIFYKNHAVYKDGEIVGGARWWASDDGGIRPVLELDLQD